MTFQDAQKRFSAIATLIQAGLTPADLLKLQNQLKALQDSLPLAEEFDPINDAIVAISPKLTGLLVAAAVGEIVRRTDALTAATALLNKTAQQAADDARLWQFERPKLIANGLVNCVSLAQELRTAAKDGDIDAVSAKADAMLALLAQLRATTKSA
jgi:hypothetical protein